MNRYITKKDKQMAKKHRKKCTSCVIRELKIKTMKYHTYLLEERKCKRLTIINAGQDVEQQDLSQSVSGNEA